MSKPVCGVCTEVLSKYTCPVCSTKYCSVKCYKDHKSSPNCIRPTEPENIENQPPCYEFETEDTVKPEKLGVLRHDRKVREALQNKHLRKMLQHLNSSKNPCEDIENAMKEPLFYELAVQCLSAIDKKPEEEELSF